MQASGNYAIDDIGEELDIHTLRKRMTDLAVEQLKTLKPQHVFDLMSTLEVHPSEGILSQIIEPWFKDNL